jgi:hypothetical protein
MRQDLLMVVIVMFLSVRSSTKLPHHPELRRSADRSVQLVMLAAIYTNTNALVAGEVG